MNKPFRAPMFLVPELLVIAPWAAPRIDIDQDNDKVWMLQRNSRVDERRDVALDRFGCERGARAARARRVAAALRRVSRFASACVGVLLAARHAKAAPEH
ncbi:MAG TPA: hypothetical protein VMB76_09895 [Casimicrobiaceae bacterium]|nr:hypothetical protein [Casimicrobiaceae bacterium]